MVSRLSTVKKIVIESLEDGKEHTSEEIKSNIQNAGIELDSKSSVLRTAIYQLRASGMEIYSRDRGIYQVKKKEKQKSNSSFSDFIVLKPERRNISEYVYVHEDGRIVLNGKLNMKIGERLIEIRISKDGKTIVLLLNGANSHKFTKSGSTQNKEIITILKTKKISLPAKYEMRFDSENGVWMGSVCKVTSSKINPEARMKDKYNKV